LRKLKSDKTQAEGFMSCTSSIDVDLINELQPDREEQKIA